MKNKILCGVVAILSIILIVVIVTKDPNHSFFDSNKENTIKIKDDGNKIQELKLEEYLIGVLAAEMPASFHEEALKAQAVASRTYAMYKINTNKKEDYDILTNITNQSFITEKEMKEKWGNQYEFYLDKIKKAIKETEQEVMYYEDKIIESFYFAMSNGTTEDSKSVFQESLPYIKSVSSNWDNESLNNFRVETNFNKEELCTKLNLNDCNTIQITNINRNNTNHIENITINNQTFTGVEVRKKLNLRSTDFEITNNNDNYTISTKGYGHGVGMSQYGANGMAKDGFTYQEILKHYYNDISIKKIV